MAAVHWLRLWGPGSLPFPLFRSLKGHSAPQDEEMQQKVKQLPEGHTATMPQGPDVKARYMWRCGPRPEKTAYPELNASPVIPKVGAPEHLFVRHVLPTAL